MWTAQGPADVELTDYHYERTMPNNPPKSNNPPKRLPPLHPGEVLREEFLVPLGLSLGWLAKVMGVPRTRVERIAAETSGVTADTALRLSKALGTSPQLWLNLQNRYDVETAEIAIAKDLDKIERVTQDAAE